MVTQVALLRKIWGAVREQLGGCAVIWVAWTTFVVCGSAGGDKWLNSGQDVLMGHLG